MPEAYRPHDRTYHHTASAIPAFPRVKYNRRLAFFRIGNKDVHLANLCASVASGTFFRIQHKRL
jgi:hypothetical protein